MKKILSFTALSIIASTTIFASGKVTICPSVSSLQSVPFNYAREVNGTWGAGVYRNTYNTEFSWLFLIDGIYAEDKERAIKTGMEVVKQMNFERGPIHTRSGGYEFDYCVYLTGRGLEGYAYTFDDGNTDFQFRK